MPELENKAVQGKSSTGGPVHTTGRDSFSSLHKMSTTAGLGSQDYVAVNGACVASFFLGLVSLIGYFNPVLLVVPLAGVVLGVIGIWRIGHSNGTQTGRGLAVVGIILSVVFAGLLIGREVNQEISRRPDRAQVVSLIERFGQHLAAQEYEEAYGLFSGRFHENVPQSQFTQVLQGYQEHPIFGPLTGFRWTGGRIEFQTDPTAGTQFARAISAVMFRDADETPFRYEFVFSRSAGQWRIENIPDIPFAQ